jgi:acetate kinase
MSASTSARRVLALNCGSSSLKYAAFDEEDVLARGTMAIGPGGVADHAAAVHAVFDELGARGVQPEAVGHRLVHGGPEHLEPERVDAALLTSLAGAVPFAPLHLPAELRAIEAVKARFGDLPQVVCFDTAFHRTLPERAQRFALPKALFDAGVRRYGFHGLSYEYVVASLGAETLGRAVLAHLGSGASMAAVRDGRSVDTTMGFTPTAGLVMGTRSGDLDPGLVVHLLEHRGYDASALGRLVNREAGLLALSGTTSDMQRLLGARAQDPRAALAIDVFCYQARKWVGALAAALGGIDALVFTGGIGEHAPEIRRDICQGLEHLGVALDDARNASGAEAIRADGARVAAYVVRTDEERMVARHTRRVLRVAA